MARRRRRKHDVIFLVAAALLIAFVWGAFEVVDAGDEEEKVDPNDTDADGMPDSWEMLKFGDLDEEPDGDYDKDGATNLDEFKNFTDPTVPPEPEPTNITIEAWFLSGQANMTFKLILTVDGVEVHNVTPPITEFQRPKVRFTEFDALPGNHTINFTAVNDSKTLSIEVTLDFSIGEKLILDLGETQILAWKNAIVPESSSCSG